MEMNISYKDVEEQCNELHQLAKNMNDTIKQIADINSKLKSAWIGIASDAYTEQLEIATNSFAEIYSAIESSILYMASCAEGYQAIDEKVMEEICNYLNINPSDLLHRESSTGMPDTGENSEDIGSSESSNKPKEEYKILQAGNGVMITDGEYKGKFGIINNVDKSNQKYKLLVDINGKETNVEVGFKNVSNNVTINDGNYKNMVGQILGIDKENNKITLNVKVNGKDTSVEVSMNQISSSKSEV